MRRLVLLGLVTALACGGSLPPAPPPLYARQPMVVAAQPETTAALAPGAALTLQFSEPIDPASLTADGVAVVAGLTQADPAVALQQWEDGAGVVTDVVVAAAADDTRVAIQLPAALQGPLIAVIASSTLRSLTGLPLSQSPGAGNVPFVAVYPVVSSAAESGSDGAGEATDDDTAAPGAGSTDETVAETATTSSPSTSVATALADVRINELLYDVEGPDTNGVCFLELRGTPGTSMGGVVVRFINGGDGKVTEKFQLPDGLVIGPSGLFVIADAVTGSPGITQVALADYVVNFDPQNGPDGAQLLSPDGTLLDVVGYGAPLVLRDVDQWLVYATAPAPDAPSGQSLSRRAGAADTGDNARDFVVNTVPSPGLMDVTHTE